MVEPSVQLEHSAPHQVHIKFQSLGSGFFPQNYAFFVRLPASAHILNAQPEVWDNSVILQLELANTDFKCYDAGRDATELHTFQLPVVVDSTGKENQAPAENHHDIDAIPFNKLTLKPQSVQQQPQQKALPRSKKEATPNTDKRRSYSESNCDDFEERHASAKPVSKDIDVPRTPIKQRTYSECSSISVDDQHGPKHLKGILKRRSSSVWSISESSLDDHSVHSRSIEFGDGGSIAEEHLSEHAKKSVRFDSNIRKFCFR